VLIVYANYWSISYGAKVDQDLVSVISMQETLSSLSVNFTRAVSRARLFLISGDKEDEAAFIQLRDQTLALLDSGFSVEADENREGLDLIFAPTELNALRKNISDKFVYLQDVMKRRREGGVLSPFLLKSVFSDPIREIENLIDVLKERIENIAHDKSATAQTKGRIVYAWTTFGLLAVVSFLIGASWLIGRSLARSRLFADQLKLESERLSRAERAKSEFLANMSHEIRTPLNAIMGFTELLRDRKLGETRKESYLEGIQTSGRVLLELINDILDLSRLEAGRMAIRVEPIDLRNMVEELRLVFEPQLLRKTLRWDIEIDPRLPPGLMLDEKRLRQILFNLIGNAVKFTHEGGIAVSVRVSDPPGTAGSYSLRLEVSDTGIGIPDEFKELIFEPFRQVENQNSRRYGGTGLGLAISKRLSESMGGSLEVESVLGKGSKFILLLPVMPAVSSPLRDGEDRTQFATVRFEPSLVLVVDDDIFSRRVMREFLEPAGLKVEEAENGRVALARMETRKPALVFMDLQMPVMDGPETIRAIRARTAWDMVRIIVLTASVEMEDEEKDILGLAQGQLRKPISRTMLLRELANHLPVRSSGEAPGTESSSWPDAFGLFGIELAQAGGLPDGLSGSFRSGTAELLSEAKKTFSVVVAEQAGRSMEELGKRYALKSLVIAGQGLAERASVVDVDGMRYFLAQAEKIETVMNRNLGGGNV